MNTRNPNEEIWRKEFNEFMTAGSSEASKQVKEKLFSQVKHDLNPSRLHIFLKLGAIQTAIGTLILLFCPQFGMSLTDEHRIMHLFMRFGAQGCMFACGTLFVGTSLLVSAYILNFDELRVLRKHQPLQISALSIASMFVFFLIGADIFEILTIAWLAGAIIGGMTLLEFGRATRILSKKVLYA